MRIFNDRRFCDVLTVLNEKRNLEDGDRNLSDRDLPTVVYACLFLLLKEPLGN